MKRSVTQAAAAVLVLICLDATGCRRGPDLGPFGDVSGKVTFTGKPVAEGAITFTSTGSGQSATIPLRPDGSYTARLGERDGLPVGEYRVYIRPPVLTQEQRAAKHHQSAAGEGRPKTYPMIPQKYRSEATSELSVTVKEEDNVFGFDMHN